jgi:tetratricopeptide (TPR) repeat protein
MAQPAGAQASELGRARLLAAEGELTAARRILEALLASDPDPLAALLLLGGVLLQLREEAPALQAFERAVALRPESVEAHNGLARCLHAIGRNQEALARALVARELLSRPESFAHTASVYLTLVWIHREERRFKEALAAAEQGLALCADAVLAQWASLVEEELEEAQQERC